jgi:DNA-binding transcriptional ArsR family regulator
MSRFLVQFLRPAVYRNGGPVLFLKKKFFGFNIYRNIAIDMGATKTEIFTERQNKLAQMLKALGHPARIAIIEQLLKTNTCINGDLVEELGLAQATISQHLKELKNIGLIQGSVEGTSVCYCIDGKVWKQYRKELEAFLVAVENNCC